MARRRLGAAFFLGHPDRCVQPGHGRTQPSEIHLRPLSNVIGMRAKLFGSREDFLGPLPDCLAAV
jgi:hypothetical protein